MPPTMLALTPPDSRWMDQAACAGAWTLMDSKEEKAVRTAKDLCASCPVWRSCRAWTLSLPPRQDVYGVAGGLTMEERQKARRRVRRCAAGVEPPRTCTRCGDTKPAAEFYLRPEGQGNRESRCLDCVRAKNREYKARQRAAKAQAVAS